MMSKRVTTIPFSAVNGQQPRLVHPRASSSDVDIANKDIHEQPSNHLCTEVPPPSTDTVIALFMKKECYKDYYGYDAVALGYGSSKLTFVKKMSLEGVDWQSRNLQKTSHQNLVNLIDIRATPEAVYFTYDRPGIPLKQLQQHAKEAFDRITVATICKEILHGLAYIHDVLKIGHGELSCENVFINQDGRVQIGDIEKGMLKETNKDVLSRDILAVCDIASNLLDLEKCSDKLSKSFLFADNFTKLPMDTRLEDLLKHPFVKISQGSWYIAHLEFAYTGSAEMSLV